MYTITTCIICDTLNVQRNWLFGNEANNVLKKKYIYFEGSYNG